MLFGNTSNCFDTKIGPREVPYLNLKPNSSSTYSWMTRSAMMSDDYRSNQHVVSDEFEDGPALVESIRRQLDATCLTLFPQNMLEDYKASPFRQKFLSKLDNPGFVNFCQFFKVAEDPGFIYFLWHAWNGDPCRANDAFHGFYWKPDGDWNISKQHTSFEHMIKISGLEETERIKAKDFVKHIDWVYEKIYDLSHVTWFGSGNMPARHYNLAPAYFTIFDPTTTLTSADLFGDFAQRNNTTIYRASYAEALKHRNLVEAQNAVSLEDLAATLNEDELVNALVIAAKLLLRHGRAYFTLPIANEVSHCLRATLDYPAEPPKFNFETVDQAVTYIQRIVRAVNERLKTESKPCFLTIEDIRLTTAGPWGVTNVRVFLDKIIPGVD